MKNIVIGIEGYVGSGKTSICRELLNIIPNSIVFHGGNLYRGIVYAFMQSNKGTSLDMKNLDIKEMMDILCVEFKVENRETVVYVKGEKIDEEKLESKEASMAVSVVGANADNSKLFIFCRNIIIQIFFIDDIIIIVIINKRFFTMYMISLKNTI